MIDVSTLDIRQDGDWLWLPVSFEMDAEFKPEDGFYTQTSNARIVVAVTHRQVVLIAVATGEDSRDRLIRLRAGFDSGTMFLFRSKLSNPPSQMQAYWLETQPEPTLIAKTVSVEVA